MKIIHLVNHLRDTGNGINNVAVDLAIQHRRQGHDVLVATSGGVLEELLERHGVGHVRIDFLQRRPGPLVKAVAQLVATVRAFRPDVVHAHTITPTVVGKLATWGRPTALVATVHNEFQSGVRLMRLADRVVGVSAAVSTSMVRRGVKAEKVVTVLNGVIGTPRRPAFDRRDAVALPPDSIVTIGSIRPRKGPDVLLEAFGLVREAVPGAQLYFVGNLDWDHIRQEAERQPWSDAVHFVGFSSNPQAYLPEAAVFALASRHDPMPLVILEALEVGVPVVASRVDGIPEALDQGRAGLLVTPGDPRDLAEKLTRVLQDPEERKSLAEAASRWGTRFTLAATADAYLDVYLGARQRASRRNPQ